MVMRSEIASSLMMQGMISGFVIVLCIVLARLGKWDLKVGSKDKRG